jgi:hypothetical protein
LWNSVYEQVLIKRTLTLLFLGPFGALCFAQNPSTATSDSGQAAVEVATWQRSPDAKQAGSSDANSDASTESASDNPWEFDIHVGYSIAPHSTGGTGSLPDVSIPSSTSADRLQPSFFFGGGAAQASAVATGNGFTAISPYDSALTSAQAQRKNGLSFGFRLGKDMNRWVGLEYQLDIGLTPLRLTNFAVNQAATTTGSLQSALNPLMALTSGVANEQIFLGRQSGKQVFNTISANLYLRASDAKWRPYFSVGGGILNNIGEDPSLDLLGTYQLSGSTLIESDELKIRYEPQRLAAVAEYGIGVKHSIRNSVAVRFDLRDNMAWENVRTKIFAFPVPPTGGTSTFVFSGNGRSIGFSNDQGTLQSTLTQTVNGATTFNASDLKHHVNASVGIVFRF